MELRMSIILYLNAATWQIPIAVSISFKSPGFGKNCLTYTLKPKI